MATELTAAVSRARRGFRSDVAALIELLRSAELLVPLKHAIDGVPLGEQVEVSELKLVPHLLEDDEGQIFCALFTEHALLDTLEEQLGWRTDDDALQFCALPAASALDMALDVIDDHQVLGLVLNAVAESELVLQRHEVASIAQSQPLPLVGYVQEIPLAPDERTLIAELDEAPPPELIEALDACVAASDDIVGYELQQTFNAERDLEPHLTLRVATQPGEPNREALAQSLISKIEGKIPPPGYIDILFEE